MADQLAFDWPTGVALGAGDFFISAANAQACAMLDTPATWPERKLVLVGPTGCGKSHLARICQACTDAVLVKAADITADLRTDAGDIIVEDMHALPPAAEEQMFHLHNSRGGTLLMTARTPPSRWRITLPDLASRMQATTVAQIADPDDALLSALLIKLFLDRQIRPQATLIRYLTARIERSFAAAADIVARLDAASLAHDRKINQHLARDLLDKGA